MVTAGPAAVTHNPNVIVVGARCAKQGIGAFVAGWFARSGAKVCAVVGTRDETVAQARSHLREAFGITCQGYTTLGAALRREAADIVAICSPYRFHAAHLAVVGQAGLHCLCEKPLHWPAAYGRERDKAASVGAKSFGHLVDAFVRQNLLLETMIQWPMTLPPFYELHSAEEGIRVHRFEMGLSPIGAGAAMIPDAAPHLVSMLRALCGVGRILDVKSEPALRPAGPPTDRLKLSCRYEGATGSTDVVLHLATCRERPRPAWYAINGRRVDREVELPTYDQFFVSENGRVPIEDPLGTLVGDFVRGVGAGRTTDPDALRSDQVGVEQLYAAVLSSVGLR